MSPSWIAPFAGTVFFPILPTSLIAQQVEQSVSIVSRDVASQVSAFSYVEGPESKLTFRGTPLTPAAEGKVDVEYQQGRSEIKAEVEKLRIRGPSVPTRPTCCGRSRPTGGLRTSV